MLTSDRARKYEEEITYNDVSSYLDIAEATDTKVRPNSNKAMNQVGLFFNYENGVYKPRKSYGKGISLLPSNPISLHDMLGVRLAAYKAGNKELRNEIIAISDELLRQKAIKKSDYKKVATML